MTNNTIRYNFTHQTFVDKVDLPKDENAGHGDHWLILSDDVANDVPRWLQQMIDKAVLPSGLNAQSPNDKLLIANNDPCHIKQILSTKDGVPQAFINAFAAVNSPYGLVCQIDKIIRCTDTLDAILQLRTTDGTTIYAFDQLYAVNRHEYRHPTKYYVNFSAWAYNITPSDQNETLLIDDPAAIRHHRAFNDVVSANDGIVPDDINERIKDWQPDDDADVLAPVEINFGHSCIYLFGETFGQEDEAWCQGQVLGISHTQFFDKDITLFDVVILREPDAQPLVVRIAAPSTDDTAKIQVQDYIQANIWLQAAIYAQNQHQVQTSPS